MGSEASITATKWPKQGRYLGYRARVMFHYVGPEVMGTIVRNDVEAPHQTLIQLDDGRIVRAAECQYSPEPAPPVHRDAPEPLDCFGGLHLFPLNPSQGDMCKCGIARWSK